MSCSGILNCNKPAGCTSRDAVNHVQRLVRPAKVGHAGTLDPLASGVLVICVGQATRLIRYVQQMPKHYRATFLLGRRSATDDVEAEVLQIPGAPIPDRRTIEATLQTFVGTIEQRPPAHSAVKIGGRRAYKLARKGVAVEMQSRPVTIHRLVLRRYEYPELELDVRCGSGTYIRSLGRDLAESLGTGAVMSALERMAIGAFTLDDAVGLADLTRETLPGHIQSMRAAVPDLSPLVLTDSDIAELKQGRPIVPESLNASAASPAEYAALDRDGGLVAIVTRRGQLLWPRLNFS